MFGPDSPLDSPGQGHQHPQISRSGGPESASRDDIFFAAIQTTRMPMTITDPHRADNPIVFANEAFVAMSGYALDEILGRNCRFLQGEETSRETVADVRTAIENEREISCEILNYRKDGTTFWNALFISPVRDHDGKVIFFFASQLDVTRRRNAENALHQAHKMEALGQLTGGIAHDFNNLLQVMGGHVEIARRALDADPFDVARAKHGLQRIKGAVGKAAVLTSRLLAFARKQRLEGRTVNLNDALRGMLQMARGSLGDDITVVERYEPGLWNCRVDPTQIEVALLNLLLNARDAMSPAGQVTVSTRNVTFSEPEPALELMPGRYVSVAVADTGHGIPPENLKLVMEPFFTTKGAAAGTGLGLAMVYGFAKQSQGAVRIESRVGTGGGTTVRLYFPALDEAPSVSRSDISGLPKGHERILVVDDQEDVAEVAGMMLESLGYAVEACTSPRTALELLEEGREFDLLLTDVIMPGEMNGVALAHRVRTMLPNMRVLLATGFAASDTEGFVKGQTEFDVIQKPYAQGDIAKEIRRVLDRPPVTAEARQR